MINFNTTRKNDFILKAIDSNHKFDKFSDLKQTYTIFNPNYNDYYLIIDKKIDGNELFRAITKFIASCKIHSFDIDVKSFLDYTEKSEHEKVIQILVMSTIYANDKPWTLNSNQTKSTIDHNLIIPQEYFDLANEYKIVANDRNFARKLQDMPSNLITPGGFETMMVEHLKKLNHVKVTVLNEKELAKNNMNLLLAVGQGAQKETDKPRLIIAKYLPNPNDKNIMAFVGKGVCFDTGGLNIKPGSHMRWMKYDMSGAAIVGSLIHSLATNNINKNVIAVMPLVLNLASSSSYRPDDVIVGHSGKSVEIDNTDAEGRLILADAISYAAKNLEASEIYDIATLTGAMIYALGDTYTGVWSTNDKLYDNVLIASNLAGELVWRLPFHHDFKDLLKSNFADISNSVSDPRGGSSRAACFLKEFTHNKEYVHFDVAGTADKGNVGTGIMLHTFYNLIKNKK